jgi:glycosyltransferase involved in cell wall biosynthesis
MSAAPAITILMPAYNAASYIREAMESILGQTFTDFEFLIIDDGSKDDTLAIIKRFSDYRIHIVSRPNKGIIATLNEGLAIAGAPLIARMDADDVCLPHRLEKQIAFMQAHPDYLVVGSDVTYIDKDGRYISRQNAPDGHMHKEMWAHRFHKCPFLHPTVMFRKEAVLAAGGYPDDALNFEDWLLWIELMEQGKVCNLDEVLVNMRINPESVTIDEKWRPRGFHEIRLRSLRQGHVSAQDAQRLKEIVGGQDFSSYKQASYHAFVAKKLLWNNPQPQLAREHLRAVIKHYPRSKEPYLLYLLSYMPAPWIRGLHKAVKRK